MKKMYSFCVSIYNDDAIRFNATEEDSTYIIDALKSKYNIIAISKNLIK